VHNDGASVGAAIGGWVVLAANVATGVPVLFTHFSSV